MMKGSHLEKYIIKPSADGKGHVYRPVMIALLNRVTKVPESILKQTKIYSRSVVWYIPFYSARKGGGGITMGSDTWQSITFTENFFSSDQTHYKGKAYANDVQGWLSMSAHEAGHLLHAVRFRFLIIYLAFFIYQYLRYGHDAAPLEIEVEAGNQELKRFQIFLNQRYGPKSLEQLITSESKDEAAKIEQLEKWWQAYKVRNARLLA